MDGMNSECNEEERPATASAALNWAVVELRGAEVDSPRLVAEVLLAHILGWERTRLLGHLHDRLACVDWERFQALVRRCASGEPLQYLTGEREFYGLPFRVMPGVLIPRPETEILVEKALDLARACEGGVRFVDVGTGSGCIAISVGHEIPHATGWATDISREALAVARENANRLGVGARIGFACCDLLECFPARPLFGLILSNPPYNPGSEMEELPRLVREYEPHQALFGGESGLEVYRRLIPQAAARLLPEGRLLLEVGAGQAGEVVELVKREGLAPDQIVEDLQRISRCIVAGRMRV
jgi:release factor glutamine methyltransferase